MQDSTKRKIDPTLETKECFHFFLIQEKKQTKSCIGTHDISCMHCSKNYYQQVAETIEYLVRETNYSELSEEDKKKQRHIHCWDKTKKGYICIPDGSYQCGSLIVNNKSKKTENKRKTVHSIDKILLR